MVNADFNNFKIPYAINNKFQEKVAYFSMEFAIDQSLKIYSGGLGFLAGSHMRSAFELKQNLIGIGLLWKYGYYDQSRNSDKSLQVSHIEKSYHFLEKTNIKFEIQINGYPVWVEALYLNPETFNCAPMFFLTTDLEENDYLSRTITNNLYDSNNETKIAQSIVLGLGGASLIDLLNFEVDIYHMNEAHGLPLAYHVFEKNNYDLNKTRQKIVFTTHTPVPAGNEKNSFSKLFEMGYFSEMKVSDLMSFTQLEGDIFDHTLAALGLCKIANGVSKIHGEVANLMWSRFDNIAKITSVTNAQNKKYWTNNDFDAIVSKKNLEGILVQKKMQKELLFKEVANQTGKLLNPDYLTIVWARRFAEYKRPDLIIQDIKQFEEIYHNTEMPIQIIWAGKPYPTDKGAVNLFNSLINLSEHYSRMAILVGYELELSRLLKQGSDVWLNNPRIPLEASGTSGMTAAMNGSINLSTFDGWIPEFIKHGINGFVAPAVDYKNLTEKEQDKEDGDTLLSILKLEILPLYYNSPLDWAKLIIQSANDVNPAFESNRMAKEYYQKIYQF